MVVDDSLCEACGTCAGVCPANAVIVMRNCIGIDHDLCRRCRACESACPVGAISFAQDK